jgi:hypothetical protein
MRPMNSGKLRSVAMGIGVGGIGAKAAHRAGHLRVGRDLAALSKNALVSGLCSG